MKYLHNFWTELVWIYTRTNSKIIEFNTGFLLFLFGLALANPFTNLVTSTKGYAFMATLSGGNDIPWAVVYGGIGLWQCCVLIKPFSHRRASLILTMTLYILLALMSVVSNIAAYGPYLFGAIAVYTCIGLRIMQED